MVNVTFVEHFRVTSEFKLFDWELVDWVARFGSFRYATLDLVHLNPLEWYSVLLTLMYSMYCRLYSTNEHLVECS